MSCSVQRCESNHTLDYTLCFSDIFGELEYVIDEVCKTCERRPSCGRGWDDCPIQREIMDIFENMPDWDIGFIIDLDKYGYDVTDSYDQAAVLNILADFGIEPYGDRERAFAEAVRSVKTKHPELPIRVPFFESREPLSPEMAERRKEFLEHSDKLQKEYRARRKAKYGPKWGDAVQ